MLLANSPNLHFLSTAGAKKRELHTLLPIAKLSTGAYYIEKRSNCQTWLSLGLLLTKPNFYYIITALSGTLNTQGFAPLIIYNLCQKE